MSHAATDPTIDKGPSEPLPGARTALVLLLSINLFNYLDRYILAAVLPRVEDEFLAGDPHAKSKLGWLTTGFLVSYMVFSPVFGWLADRMSRWLLIGIGVILWSLASGASGLAETYVVLLTTRLFLGIGEAAYGPAAPTVIADLYPVKRRGSVLAWFYMAIPVGSALGYVFGGAMAESSLGWRWAFYLVVLPGILLGAWSLMMREPRRGAADAGADAKPAEAPHHAGLADYLALARIPSYVLNTLGMTAMTFAVGGVSVWMPTYIYEREARFEIGKDTAVELEKKKLPADIVAVVALSPGKFDSKPEFEAHLKKVLTQTQYDAHRADIVNTIGTPGLGLINTIFGGIVVIAGLTATLAGGLAGDKLRDRMPGSYFLVSGWAMFAGFPLFIAALWAPMPWAWGFIFAAVFCLFFNTGPTNTVLANVTKPSVRASAFALNILIIHMLGDAISPPIIGYVADHSDLRTGFLVVSGMIVLSGVLWIAGSRHLARDTAAANA